MEKKQSSIEWIVEKLENLIPQGNQIVIGVIFEQAKAMHKDEIKDAYKEGNHSEMRGGKVIFEKMEDYYNEKFGGEQ